MNYERREIERVVNDDVSGEDSHLRLKITAPTSAETRWLNITREQAQRIADLLDKEVPDDVHDGIPNCLAQSPLARLHLWCTLAKGHMGPHVATDTSHGMLTWPTQ